MNCPNCGAALELVANRPVLHCKYCESTHVPDESIDGLIALDEDHKDDCPCCGVRLKVGGVEGKAVAYCPECRGLLTSATNFAAILGRRRAKTRGMDPNPVGFDPSELNRKTACPKCRRRMDTHPYGGGGNAVIDSCLVCRLVWLDAGELTVLERYVPPKPR